MNRHEKMLSRVPERLRQPDFVPPIDREGPEVSKVLSGLPTFSGTAKEDVELFLEILKNQLEVRSVARERWPEMLISALKGEAFKILQLYRQEVSPFVLTYDELQGKLIAAFKSFKDPHFHLLKLLKLKIDAHTSMESFVLNMKIVVAEANPKLSLAQRDEQVKTHLINALPDELKLLAVPYADEEILLGDAIEKINNLVECWEEKMSRFPGVQKVPSKAVLKRW